LLDCGIREEYQLVEVRITRELSMDLSCARKGRTAPDLSSAVVTSRDARGRKHVTLGLIAGIFELDGAFEVWGLRKLNRLRRRGVADSGDSFSEEMFKLAKTCSEFRLGIGTDES
jgi:hypothetical protein